MPMSKSAIRMPAWMDLLDPVGPSLPTRSSRADEHPRPWLRTKPNTLHSDMKSIILDFQKRSELSGIKERIYAGAPTEMRRAERRSSQRPPLDYSDQMLARDIVITDMQTRINQLKCNLSAEQQRFDREIVEARARLKDLQGRDIELGTQNAFLRQAILDGRMGSQVDTQLFEELYNDLVRVDREEDSEDEDFDHSEEDLSPLARSARPPSKTFDQSVPRKLVGTSRSLSMRREGSLVDKADSFIKAIKPVKIARDTTEWKQIADCDALTATFENPKQRPRHGGLTRTLSSTIEDFIEDTYDPAAPVKIKRSTSSSNVLLAPSPTRSRQGGGSPATRLLKTAKSTVSAGSPKVCSPFRRSLSQDAKLPRAISTGPRTLSPALSFSSASPCTSPLLSPATAERQGTIAAAELRLDTIKPSSDWSESESSYGAIDNETPSKDEKHDTMLPRYMNLLMEYHQALPGQLPVEPITGSEAEFLKRQSVVLEEVAAILAGSENFRQMRDIIDTADAKCRVDMVNVLARQLKFTGKLVHGMHSMNELAKLPMDPSFCCDLFVEEIKKLVGGQRVRLWLVDEKKSCIWEHDPEQANPAKRPFVAPGERSRASTPKSNNAEDLALRAVWHGAVVDEPVQLDPDIMCEPVRYKGAIVAIIQCFVDVHQENAAPFTQLDHLQLCYVCELAGVIFHRMLVFQDSIGSVERALRTFALTSHYPCSALEIYALTRIQLQHAQNMLGASFCLIYLTAGHGLKERRMWTRRGDGIDTTVEVAYGRGIAGWVAEQEAPVVSNDAENDKRFDFVLDTAYAAGLRADSRKFLVSSVLAVPMKRQDGSLFGVCSMVNHDNRGSGEFTRADLRFLELQCELTMLSFKETRLEDNSFTAYENVPEALRRIRMLLRVEWSLYFQMAEDKSKLTLEWPVRMTVPIDDMFLGYVARTGVILNCRDASIDPRFNAALAKGLGSNIKALLCLPVQDGKDRSKLSGVLFIANRINGSSGEGFVEEDISMAEVLARQIGQMITTNPQQSLAATASRNQDMERMEDLAKHKISITHVEEG